MNPKIKKIISPFLYFLLTLGFDPRKTICLLKYPRFLKQYLEFKKKGGNISHRYTILTDYEEQAGSASGHYFHQDLIVASLIYKKNPERHIDIGSRIDGFVAHVASFRKIEVIDVRKLENTGHENISFIKADIMEKNNLTGERPDSISCLHAIEHFGLGRYGDPINPNGHKKGFNNILQMLRPGGTLYISFPISNKNEVHFNAHRVFHPKDIFNWTNDDSIVKLERFDYVDDYGRLNKNIDLFDQNIDVIFGCGIYTFKKI